MKQLWIALAISSALVLFTTESFAEGHLVCGDSQSFVVQDTGDASKNWPHLLQEFTGWHFFNLSRGGRKLSDGYCADHLRLSNAHRDNQQAETLIIALGSLDALWGLDVAEALLDAINEAAAREMRVVCILPPDNAAWDVSEVRQNLRDLCPQTIDISLFVTPDLMPDGVHLSEEGHQLYALGVAWGGGIALVLVFTIQPL